MVSDERGYGGDTPVRFVWINAYPSIGRLGYLWDCDKSDIIAEGGADGFIYGSPETGRLIIDALNAYTRPSED